MALCMDGVGAMAQHQEWVHVWIDGEQSPYNMATLKATLVASTKDGLSHALVGDSSGAEIVVLLAQKLLATKSNKARDAATVGAVAKVIAAEGHVQRCLLFTEKCSTQCLEKLSQLCEQLAIELVPIRWGMLLQDIMQHPHMRRLSYRLVKANSIAMRVMVDRWCLDIHKLATLPHMSVADPANLVLGGREGDLVETIRIDEAAQTSLRVLRK